MKRISLTNLAFVLLVAAHGCSQFPVLSKGPAAPIEAHGDAQAIGLMQFGEDPGAFQSAVDPAQRRANVLMTRARLAIVDGDTDTAVELLEGFLDAEPGHAQAAHILAVLRAQSGNVEAAEKHFQTAIAADRDNPRLNADYGYFCYLADRWEDAEQYLTRAVEIEPDLRQAHTNLGMLEARRGDTAAARRRFQNAGCSDVEVLNNLALARFLEEDFETAELLYRQAREMDPDHLTVKNGLQMVNHMWPARAGGPAASVAAGTVTIGDQ